MMNGRSNTFRAGLVGAEPADQREEDAIWSRINWRIVPVILIAYIMAFLDRINVGYAKLTMQQDLQFSDAVYGLGAGIFFFTYLIFEVPSNLWLEKVGVYTLTFWLPTMVKALGVADVASVGWYTAIPFGFGAIGILLISRSSDYFMERRWHVAATLIIGSIALYCTTFTSGAFLPSMILLSISAFFIFGCALFWSIPPTYLSREAAATGITVISSIGILGGFVSPTLIGWVKTVTGSLSGGLLVMTVLICLGGLTVLIGVPKKAVRVGVGEAAAAH